MQLRVLKRFIAQSCSGLERTNEQKKERIPTMVSDFCCLGIVLHPVAVFDRSCVIGLFLSQADSEASLFTTKESGFWFDEGVATNQPNVVSASVDTRHR